VFGSLLFVPIILMVHLPDRRMNHQDNRHQQQAAEHQDNGKPFEASEVAGRHRNKIGFGRLPGDIVIERDNLRVYIPLATSLLVSVIISLILWLANR